MADRMFHMRILFGCLLIVIASLAHGASQDDDFLAARQAYRAGDSAKLARLDRRLDGYILEPYVAYWRLQVRLNKADPGDVRAFLEANAGSPLAERLRSDWLKFLGKHQQWELFDAELPLLVREDIEITCYALQSRLRLDPSALYNARPLWFVGRRLPESCGPLFAALADAHMLSADDLWTRIRLVLEAGQIGRAGRIAELLPKSEAPNSRLLSSISSNPARYLARRHFDFGSRAGRETTMFAAYRLARTSPSQAAAHWNRLEGRFNEEERGYVWGLIAYLGAIRHDRDALTWYARAGDNLSDVQFAWKARAALRATNWPEVLAAIAAMTRKESAKADWRYWKARALKALGHNEEAAAILGPLAAEYNFYGQLATEELGGRVTRPVIAFIPGADDVRAISQLPGIQRALALFRLDLRLEGVREWVWAIRGFDDRRLLAAAELARRNGIYDRAINTAEKTVMLHDFDLRYLAPYRDVLQLHASEMGLDEAWVYGLIRQESRFIAGVRSSAGAAGLMQLMPGTARWVARKLGLRNWRWSKVTDIDTNINFGTYYLRHVLDKLDGQPVLASAAYNAGPGRARRWRPDTPIEGAVYAETIPFNETRDYVKKVMANATYYAQVFGQRVQALKARLGVIGPSNPGADAADDTP
jgi:soluble lytic murein transglycosylase